MIEISEELRVTRQLNEDGEARLTVDYYGQTNIWIGAEQAEELIDHLQKLFKLDNK